MANISILTGRLTKDPVTRYTSNSQMAVCNFTLAVDRPSKNGNNQADFPRIVVFGRQAENCDKYLSKGRMVLVVGSIQTGQYQNQEGETVYTTDVVANRVEFLGGGKRQENGNYQSHSQEAYPQEQSYQQEQKYAEEPKQEDLDMPDSFEALDEKVPY